MTKYNNNSKTDIMAVYTDAEPAELIDRLREQNADLFSAMNRMSAFQESMMNLRESKTVDQTLDVMEALLDEVITFSFLRIYIHTDKSDDDFTLIREMCPDEFMISWELVRWAITKREVSLIPLTETDIDETEDVKSLLILPLIGHSQEVGVLLLWVDADMSSFTHEQSTLLNMLARETASVLEQLILRHQLENARAEIADIVENIPLGVMAVDSNEQITLINGTAEFIFNINRNEAEGVKLSELIPQSSLNELRKLLNYDDSSQLESELEIKLSEEVNESFGVSAATVRMVSDNPFVDDDNESEKNLGHVIVCRDLKLSHEVARLRELDTMKNDFLSLVSHELRTPLTSIMAYSETLLMEGMVDTEEERKEYLEIIHSEGDRLSRLINDVLDLTKMEAGKMDFNYESVNINAVIKSANNAVYSLSEQKNMNMVLELSDDIPEIRADNDKIIQVLTNLYSNAIKFTDEEGTITTKSKLYTDEETMSKSIEVSVTDTGIGIAPEDIHKVFSKFEMVEKMDHHSVGTGLGMPICKQIVEEGHAGKIWIESEVGAGTTFLFRLPIG
ncbi:MAG: ATP-binding protein [Planctomycetota bacterium]|jgi:signal transduction histidine kinase